VFVLLRHGEVFAPERAGRRDLLVAAGTVVAVGESVALPNGVDGEVVELDGARVVPGLVDAHVHLTGGGGESGPSTRVPPVELSTITRAGVTTAVGLLGTDTTTRSMEALIAQTLALREEGLSAYCWTGGYAVPPLTLTGSVRRDISFVDPILGVGETAISDHRSSQPTLEELLKLAADCHVAGLMSGKAGILHLHVGDGKRGMELIRRALETAEIPARVYQPTHVNRQPWLLEEAAQLAKRGVTVDVTAFPAPDDGDDDPAVPAHEAIERLLKAGAPPNRITVSSDGGGCLPTFDGDGRMVTMDVGRPETLADTLARLVERGMPLERALPFFTTRVADLLRLRTKGRIAVGADADLVVLDDDHRPRSVMARGRWMVRDGKPVKWGTFEQPHRHSTSTRKER
jgi:beta-aspartyl-dipeptidase (metallo-type)